MGGDATERADEEQAEPYTSWTAGRATRGQPLYQHITAVLTDQINRGDLPPGTLLPPEVELARRFGVSRHTMRAGLDALVRAGLLERRRGKGTVVMRARIEQSLQRFYSVEREMRRLGADLRTLVIARGRLDPADELAAHALDRPPVEDVTEIGYLVRLRLVDGVPLLLETATFPVRLLPLWLEEPSGERDDPASHSLYDALRAATGETVTRAHETFRPVSVSGYEARLLRVPPGTPAFEVERTSYIDERPVEWRRTLARGDRFTYSVDLANPTDEAGGA
jgi:GntR family transcriptional regulator, N-acetylglucosamine utilization regulator